MPELPETEAYVAALGAHVVGQALETTRLASPFLLRTVEPPLDEAHGKTLESASRLGKRILMHFCDGPTLVIHPMISGRLRWKKRGAGLPGKAGLLAFDFVQGTLVLTEQGSKKRASLHAFADPESALVLDPGGLEVIGCDPGEFEGRLRASGHTLKRALTSPKIFSGIGNAWSDEILWEARLSPAARAGTLKPEKVEALFQATQSVLTAARDRLVERALQAFPDKVTAFQPEMAVHGRFQEPCPRCESPIQRITRAAGHDFHYCAECQTGGRILADRSLSRLLKDSWPKRLEDL